MSTAPTPIPDYTEQLPDPADPDTFTSRGLLWWNYERYTMVPGFRNAADNAYENAVAAESAAATAATLAGASIWSAATNYSTGDAAISPITLQTYRRKSPGGVDATDPSASSNWTIINGDTVRKSGETGVSSISFATGGYVGKDQYMSSFPPPSSVYVAHDPVFVNPSINSATYVGVSPNGTGAGSGYYAKYGSGTTTLWGGFIMTSSGLDIHSSHSNTPSVPGKIRFKFSNVSKAMINTDGTIECFGVKGRQGTSGATSGNTINFWWTGSAMEVWVDGTKVGTLNITP